MTCSGSGSGSLQYIEGASASKRTLPPGEDSARYADLLEFGAGPGGLTLARILQTRHIPTTVFERENHPDERPQGGTLDLHPESGQLAVHLAVLDAPFQAIARYEGQGMRRLSKDGRMLFEIKAEEGQGDRPEVDRTALRAMKKAIAPDAATHIPPVFRQAMPAAPSSLLRTRREAFADGLTVRVDELGNGRPIVILHGAAGPQSVSGLASGLARQARVLIPTHPGFEGEPRPEWFNGVDDLAFTYLDLLERLDLREVVLIGLSFGGWIAAELAVLNTTRLSGLVLIDAAGIQVDEHLISLMRSPTSDQAGAPESGPAGPQALRAYIGPNGLRDPKLRRRLTRVRIPTLCLWGEHDRIVPPDYGRAYAQALPNARFELIPEAGHLPRIEQPERLLTIVKGFVDSITVPSITRSFEKE